MIIPMRLQPNEFDSALEMDELHLTFIMTAEEYVECPICYEMESDSCINIEISEGEKYPGPYNAIPLAWDEVILPTKYKLMDDDVTVEEIPYAETSNIYGTTVTIAS